MCFKFQTVPFCFLSCAPKKLHFGRIWDESFGPVDLFATFAWVLQRSGALMRHLAKCHQLPWNDTKKRLKTKGTKHNIPEFSVSLRCVLEPFGWSKGDLMIPQVAEWTTNHAEAPESCEKKAFLEMHHLMINSEKVWNIKSPQLWHLQKQNLTYLTKIQCLESKHSSVTLYTTESDGFLVNPPLRGFAARWSSAFTIGWPPWDSLVVRYVFW